MVRFEESLKIDLFTKINSYGISSWLLVGYPFGRLFKRKKKWWNHKVRVISRLWEPRDQTGSFSGG